jgi:hypothetical protein
MNYAIYNAQNNLVRTFVTAPLGMLPEGYEFRPEAEVPADAVKEATLTPVEPVPDEVYGWALREVCMIRGHTAAIEAALANLPEPQRTIASNRWSHKPTISRASSLIAAMQAILGWTSAYVDELFIEAAAK